MIGALGAAIGLIVISVAGHFIFSGSEKPRALQDRFNENKEFIQNVIDSVEPENIRENLKFLSQEPHLAGLRRDQELTEWIKAEWEKSGLDKVTLSEYDFYLSWPNQSEPNKVYLLDQHNQVQFVSRHMEEVFREEDSHEDFVHAYNGFAPAGDVTGELVYVNYGRVEDFQYLEKIGISIKQKLCIARYGKIFRGNKVTNCKDNGGIGVILYSDPAEVALQGTEPNNVYPHTIFLPGSGIQRGSISIGDGEPLSPGWPSVSNAYRLNPKNQKEKLIPTQPIGYDDARILLEKLGGTEVTKSWIGGLKNITYRYGGGMLQNYEGWKVRLKVNNFRGTVKSSNVIGIIQGDVEPDRYVIIGNHRDAWGYGAMDPSSGTAQLMEVVQVLGKLKDNGWRPRRTIMFCSWASEESGLMGSTEWVEENLVSLMSRAVGYINNDKCVTGPIIDPLASPSMKDIVKGALKAVPDPFEGQYLKGVSPSGPTYYNLWHDWFNQGVLSGQEKEPEIRLLGSASDQAPFAFIAGIPAIDTKFKDDSKKYPGIGKYPVYHTGYETFFLVDTLIDPGFKISKLCAQTSLHMLLELSDSLVIPYNFLHESKLMRDELNNFKSSKAYALLRKMNISLDFLEQAINLFDDSVYDLQERNSNHEYLDEMQIRSLNDQLMLLERLFISPQGLPGRPNTRHAIFAPSKHNLYGASTFPGLKDLTFNLEKLEGEERFSRVEDIKKHISDLMIMMNSAAKFLRPPADF